MAFIVGVIPSVVWGAPQLLMGLPPQPFRHFRAQLISVMAHVRWGIHELSDPFEHGNCCKDVNLQVWVLRAVNRIHIFHACTELYCRLTNGKLFLRLCTVLP